MILYGIPTCDTCKKAIKALEGAGHSVSFRDVRTAPLSEAEWATLLAEFGDALVNRKSTTWRSLSDYLRESEADVQLAAQPTLMKRPVIHADGAWYLGWDEGVQAALLR
jgi:arsenate reductase-like glutaredoxin family protein